MPVTRCWWVIPGIIPLMPSRNVVEVEEEMGVKEVEVEGGVP